MKLIVLAFLRHESRAICEHLRIINLLHAFAHGADQVGLQKRHGQREAVPYLGHLGTRRHPVRMDIIRKIKRHLPGHDVGLGLIFHETSSVDWSCAPRMNACALLREAKHDAKKT